MSDQTEKTTEPDQTAETVRRDAADAPLGEAGKKALAAEREARKAAEKAAAEYQARIKELEAAQMSDLERAQAAAKEAQEAAVKATTEALRWKVAAEFQIAAEDAEVFLTGSDEESIRKQAQRLAELAASKGPTVPKPDPSQGAKGTPPPATPAQKFAAAFEGRL